ncbi:MAG: SGNH/GDSL hydrolase family protein [Nocardioidaceae bacterium]
MTRRRRRPLRTRRLVALGDSTVEGLEDPGPDGRYVGWADRFAARLALAYPDLVYANLAIRGQTSAEVRRTQLDRALALRPDCALLVAGVNDLLRPRLDRAAEPIAAHPPMWHADRLHASPQGHARIAASLAEAAGLETEDWRAVPPDDAAGRLRMLGRELTWIGGHLAPWAYGRLRGRDDEPEKVCKRPELTPVQANMEILPRGPAEARTLAPIGLEPDIPDETRGGAAPAAGSGLITTSSRGGRTC